MKLTVELVKLIILEQFPEFKHLAIKSVEKSGNDNQSFHLGSSYSLRFPSSSEYATQVIKEHSYCLELQKNISIQITHPILLGRPSNVFPYHFSINQWIEGETLTHFNIDDENKFAIDLANFILSLQSNTTIIGPEPGLHNFYRGASLKQYDDETIKAIQNEAIVEKEKCLKIWDIGLNSVYSSQPVWIHGDLEVGNILVRDGKLVAVIDFGNMAVGDPACDYVIAWTFFGQTSRTIFFNTLKLDKQTIDRAKCWALWKALITINDPVRSEQAKRTLHELLTL